MPEQAKRPGVGTGAPQESRTSDTVTVPTATDRVPLDAPLRITLATAVTLTAQQYTTTAGPGVQLELSEPGSRPWEGHATLVAHLDADAAERLGRLLRNAALLPPLAGGGRDE